MEKIKVLALHDYCSATGFSNLASNIWRRLYATGKYDLSVVGINYTGDPYDQTMWPGNVYTAISGLNLKGNYADLYGRQKFLDILSMDNYDLVFMIQDTFIVQTFVDALVDLQSQVPKPGFKTIFYFPIDAKPHPVWIKDELDNENNKKMGAVTNIDYPVAYTNYAYDECVKIEPKLADKLRVLYHGNDFDHFFPMTNKEDVANFRHVAFNADADDKFLVININRNQRRKDITRSFLILKELKDRGYDDIVFYFHMSAFDVGGNLIDIANWLGLEMNKDYLLPVNFNPHDGLPVEVVNYIYNSADCFLTTTHGEGFGFSVSEAMATRCPIVAPANTALNEILGDGRGHLVSSGADSSMWIHLDADNDVLRPLMDVKEAADRIIDIKNGKLPDVDAAFDWIHKYSWDNIVKEWDALFMEAYSDRMKSSKPTPKPAMAIPKGKIKRRR